VIVPVVVFASDDVHTSSRETVNGGTEVIKEIHNLNHEVVGVNYWSLQRAAFNRRPREQFVVVAIEDVRKYVEQGETIWHQRIPNST